MPTESDPTTKAADLLQNLSPEAKQILKEGRLPELTIQIARGLVHDHPYGIQVAQELMLAIAGQVLQQAVETSGQEVRVYNHLLGYAPPGHGKKYAIDALIGKGIKPPALSPFGLILGNSMGDFSTLKMPQPLDSATLPVIIGSATKEGVIPSVFCDNSFVVTEEAATLLGSDPRNAEVRNAVRKLVDAGQYSRAMRSLFGLQAELAKDDAAHVEWDDNERQEKSEDPTYIMKPYRQPGHIWEIEQGIEHARAAGMEFDFEKGIISIERASATFILCSADFEMQGGSLVGYGDLTRYRCLALTPTKAELREIVASAGNFPSYTPKTYLKAVQEAWQAIVMLKNFPQFRGFIISEQDHSVRSQWWEAFVKEADEIFPQMAEDEFRQYMNMRYNAEFHRVAFQHALMNQYRYDFGQDLSMPETFTVARDDYEYTKNRFLDVYLPSLFKVVADVRRPRPERKSTSAKGYALAISEAALEQALRSKPGGWLSSEEASEVIKQAHAGNIDRTTIPRHLRALHNRGKIVWLPHRGIRLPQE